MPGRSPSPERTCSTRPAAASPSASGSVVPPEQADEWEPLAAEAIAQDHSISPQWFRESESHRGESPPYGRGTPLKAAASRCQAVAVATPGNGSPHLRQVSD